MNLNDIEIGNVYHYRGGPQEEIFYIKEIKKIDGRNKFKIIWVYFVSGGIQNVSYNDEYLEPFFLQSSKQISRKDAITLIFRLR